MTKVTTAKTAPANKAKGRRRAAAGPPQAVPAPGGTTPLQGTPLQTWRTLNVHLTKLTEQQAWALLQQEIKGAARVQVVLRLYGRYNKLRAVRERRELLGASYGE